MKKLFVIAAVAANISVMAQQTIDLNPPVKKVTVYLRGAIVTHEISAELPQGKSTVIFHRLPSNIDKESIQLSSTGDITILSVSSYEDYLSDSKKNVKTKKWSDSLTVLKDELERLHNEEDILEDGKKLLDNNRNTAGANNCTNAATVKAMYEYYVHQVAHIDDSLMFLDRRIRTVNSKIDKINQELNEWKSRADTLSSDVEAIVSCTSAQSLSFRLAYLTYEAGWAPLYDLRAKDIKHNCQLTYKASVYQHTGDDWNNVDLTLSTSNPEISQTAPELSPWYLVFQQYYNNYNQKAKKRDYAEAYSERNTVAMDSSPSVAGVAAPVYNQPVVANTTQETQLTTEFHIDIPYTLPTDGKAHTVDVKQFDLPVTYRYATVPKLNQNAFLMADVVHWENLDLLSAEVNIYYAGAYVGKSYINTATPTDTLSFSLGMDKKLNIKRERVKELTSIKWINENKTENFGYSITIHNLHSDSLTLMVYDQVPVSNENSITVEVLDKGGAAKDDATGKLTWRVPLAAGETKKLTFSYSVKYPKDKVVQGLR